MRESLRELINKAMETSLANPPKIVEEVENDPEELKFLRAGIPERYIEAPAVDTYADLIERGGNVYIFGKVGTGKTYLAAGVIKDYITRHPYGAVYVSSVRLLARIRETYDSDISEAAVLEHYEKARLLILDDLGKEAPTQWALERLFLLIDTRYSRKLPTIVTTNYKPSELIERLGARGDLETAAAIVSRLVDGGERVLLTGEDRRLSHD